VNKDIQNVKRHSVSEFCSNFVYSKCPTDSSPNTAAIYYYSIYSVSKKHPRHF